MRFVIAFLVVFISYLLLFTSAVFSGAERLAAWNAVRRHLFVIVVILTVLFALVHVFAAGPFPRFL